MGNVESNSSYQKHLLRFLPDEQADIDAVFGSLCGVDDAVAAKTGKAAKRGVTLATLKAHVKDALPESMVVRLYDGMKSLQLTEKSPGPNSQMGKEQFVVFMSLLLKGNAEEKRGVIMKMISKTGGSVKGNQILEFAEDLVGSLVHVLSHRKELKGWNLKNMQNSSAGVKALASQLISELKSAGVLAGLFQVEVGNLGFIKLPKTGSRRINVQRSCTVLAECKALPDGKKIEGPQALDATYDEGSIEDWVFKVPQVSAFLSIIVQQGLLIFHSLPDQGRDALQLLPECKGIKGNRFVSLLDIPSITYINSHLPSELQHEWKLLFASRLHGESFTQLCGHIVNKGPCILVLRDADGYIFGGFSSCSWEVKPQFQGSNACFLFSISPALGVFTYTGYNDHYMYLNHGQQTMPNGLGMGGQHEYFGLWVDGNYGKGHSKAKPRCTTYNSPQLSAKENFTLDAMEVWAVGGLPENATGKGPKSILDVDPEAQALLEMIGKSRQSDGLRVPDEDGDNNNSE